MVFEVEGKRLVPSDSTSQARLVNQSIEGDRLQTQWEVHVGQQRVRYNLCLRIVNRSLVVETEVEGPSAEELRIGYPDCAGGKRAIEVPMLTWDWNRLTEETPCFVKFLRKHENVETQVAPKPATMQKAHDFRKVQQTEIVRSHSGIEALQPEIDGIRAVLNSRSQTLPIAGRSQQLGSRNHAARS